MDFNIHRPHSRAWVREYNERLGEERYTHYQAWVWTLLDRLQPAQFYDMGKIAPERRDLFIKMCCQYIESHKDYEFSIDFTKIKRLECITTTNATGPKPKKTS